MSSTTSAIDPSRASPIAALALIASAQFRAWPAGPSNSPAFSTYQAGELFLPDGGLPIFNRPSGARMRTGGVGHSLRAGGATHELCDVATMPDAIRPLALGFRSDEIHRMITIAQTEIEVVRSGTLGVTSVQRAQLIFRTMRRRLLARTSALAMQAALRPAGWASSLLAVGLLGAAAPALAQETIDLATDAEVVIEGVAAGDGSDSTVRGAGDVNDDGLDDLIIGAPEADPNGRRRAGASYVILGSDQGLPAVIDLAEADVVIQGAAAGDLSGFSVSAAGDVNDDGIDDLIIGAPLADPNGRLGAGASYVIFGSDQGLPAVIDLADDADLIIDGVAPVSGVPALSASR